MIANTPDRQIPPGCAETILHGPVLYIHCPPRFASEHQLGDRREPQLSKNQDRHNVLLTEKAGKEKSVDEPAGRERSPEESLCV